MCNILFHLSLPCLNFRFPKCVVQAQLFPDHAHVCACEMQMSNYSVHNACVISLYTTINFITFVAWLTRWQISMINLLDYINLFKQIYLNYHLKFWLTHASCEIYLSTDQLNIAEINHRSITHYFFNLLKKCTY